MHLTDEQPGGEAAGLFQHIIEVSGSDSVNPSAVALRTAEVEAGVEDLRPHDEQPA